MKIHFCDLCNESVPQQAVDAGNVVTYQGRTVCLPTVLAGRVVCGVCHRPLRTDPVGGRLTDPARAAGAREAAAAKSERASGGEGREPVFCDLCNESLPVFEEEAGRVSRADGRACGKPEVRDGRVVCQVCDRVLVADLVAARIEAPAGAARLPAAAGAGVPAAAGAGGPGAAHHGSHAPVVVARGGGGALWVALVALLFAGGAAAWVGRELVDLRESVEGDARASAVRLDALSERQRAALAEGLDERRALDERLETVAAEQARVLAGLADEIRGEAAESARGVATLRDEVAALRADLAKRVRSDDERFIGLGESLVRLEEDLRFHADRLGDLELALERGVVPVAPGGGGAGAAAAGTPAWQGLVADLANPNAGIRWEAVDALGATGDPAVVAHLVPMLKDVDLFVRMATARVLGDLGSTEAVPHLIDALEDGETAMREQAMVSLRRLTGRDFKFDPLAKEGERAKKVKAWRDWWEKEGQKS